MTKFRYVKRGVKRQHQIVEGILEVLEVIAKIDGVKKVIPAKISYSPKRSIGQPNVKFQRYTISGFKLIAHSKGAVQEIFVVVDETKKDEVENKIRTLFSSNLKMSKLV